MTTLQFTTLTTILKIILTFQMNAVIQRGQGIARTGQIILSKGPNRRFHLRISLIEIRLAGPVHLCYFIP